MAHIPFDSLSLYAVIDQLQRCKNAKVQKIISIDIYTLGFELYNHHKEYLLLSCDPEFARTYLICNPIKTQFSATDFCIFLRTKLIGARIGSIKQRGFDRILEIEFVGFNEDFILIAELMGKHSNIIFINKNKQILGSIKSVSASQSKRPILTGRTYFPPPFEPKKTILEASIHDDLKLFEGYSPFLLKLLNAQGLPDSFSILKKIIQAKTFQPVYCKGLGAYPISVSALGIQEELRSSFSKALEEHFEFFIAQRRLETSRLELFNKLKRIYFTHQKSLKELKDVLELSDESNINQEKGNLLLIYHYDIKLKASQYEAFNEHGKKLFIKLNPNLTPIENAQNYFTKAKQAKKRKPFLEKQLIHFEKESSELAVTLLRIESAPTLTEINQLRAFAQQKQWLWIQKPVEKQKEKRPFEGHNIKKAIAPGNYIILYGGNAESNHFLITRVAKPNDIWLHVRGSTSAHVVIQTHNHPEKVQIDTLLFAAKIALQNSGQKHAAHVPVDYTLNKFVRKPKGAPIGSVIYSREKTLYL